MANLSNYEHFAFHERERQPADYHWGRQIASFGRPHELASLAFSFES